MLSVDILIEYGALRIESAFDVPSGSGAALMGPSGSGKSSILSVISGFYAASRMRIEFEGQALDQLKPADRPLTILFQEHNLFAHLTVWQNIAIGLNPKLKVNGAERELIQSSLNWVGLNNMDQRLPATLSGGQKQRVALARCLARDKPILLLDEPFKGLDESLQQDMRDLILRSMQDKKLTLLMATHQAEDAAQLCKQIIEVG